MDLNKREFLHLLGMAAAAGLPLARMADADAASAQAALYDLPPAFKGAGAVSLLHFTDCHAQLNPIRFREPSVNLGIGAMQGQWPHRVGEHLLKAAGVAAGSDLAHAYTYLDFEAASRRFGKVGGFAHLATLVKQLRASRPGTLLLDGGDTWQGSALALWTNAQDMVDAAKLLGVDVMTGHWEFTYGMQRVKQIVDGDFKGGSGSGAAAHRVDFVAQNVKTADFGDPVFAPYVIRPINGVPVAIVGQAFPYTPIANPRYLVADWEFGIQDANLQKMVDEARAKGAQVVVVLSHNGMDVDLKMASRVRGVDAIFGGHTHDGVPVAVPVKNAGGTTLVTNAGSNGKFLGVMDFQVQGGKVADFRYRLLPVFSNALVPDAAMQALITKLRAPHAAKLDEKLAVTDGLLYRRGNFNGSWDQLVCDALMEVQGADLAFSPGFRWGTSLLPGEAITRELLMDQLAITYPYATLTSMSGETIKTVLEDVADNLFNPDPYYQQGGDMVRVGGMSYTMDPNAKMGSRIGDMRLGDKPIEAGKTYKVAGWAPVAEEAKNAPGVKPVWEVVEAWLKSQGGRVKPRRVNMPALVGMAGNTGIAP
ncbi:MAG: thiosulfohydrolase SoxB [Burkholderiaceae bacterium]|nr:thiosulfohydrolase SoxB [Burkholderiaceae bacterium]